MEVCKSRLFGECLPRQSGSDFKITNHFKTRWMSRGAEFRSMYNFTIIKVLEEEAIASEAKSNPANFCRRLGFDRHCICEMPGQVPCPTIVPIPRHWRGKWWNQGYRWEEED